MPKDRGAGVLPLTPAFLCVGAGRCVYSHRVRCAAFVLGIGLTACGTGQLPLTTQPPRTDGPTPSAPPEARWFPRHSTEATVVGHSTEGTLAMAHGLRLLLRAPTSLPDAAPHWMIGEQARQPRMPTGALLLPKHLGGGVMLSVEAQLWYAKGWLDEPTLAWSSTQTPNLSLGLRELILREAARPDLGLHLQTTGTDAPRFESAPLQGYPTTPTLFEVAARDARHAALVADLRGLMLTEDGGRSWREVPQSRAVLGVEAHGEGYRVRGRVEGREVYWRLDVHGETLGDAPKPTRDTVTLDGGRLERVILHGYASEQQYEVLHEGLFERYRRSDGALLASSPVLDPRAICQAISLPLATGPRAGFACSSPEETTLLQVQSNQPQVIARYPGARRTWSWTSGGLAVSGACEPVAESDTKPDGALTSLCVHGRGTVRLAGTSDGDRFAVLADRTVVVLRPPRRAPTEGQGRGAELFLHRPGGANTAVGVALRLDAEDPASAPESLDLQRHWLRGRWHDTLEVHADGSLTAWIEHEGALRGLRIQLDGRTRVGPKSPQALAHATFGQRSLSWSPNGQLFESLDGGAHYHEFSLPLLPVPSRSRSTSQVGCTELGCVLPSMLRLGWGQPPSPPQPPPNPQTIPAPQPPLTVELECKLIHGVRERQVGAPSAPQPPGLWSNRWGHPNARPNAMWSFFGSAPPAIGDATVAGSHEPDDLLEGRWAPAGMLYTWGDTPITGFGQASFLARWYVPTSRQIQSTAISPLTPELLHVGRWSLTPSFDGQRAVAMAEHQEHLLFSLRPGEAPTPITHEHGPMRGVQALLPTGGDQVFIAAAGGFGESTEIYLASAGVARTIARLPRRSAQSRPPVAGLLAHTDGARIALAVTEDGTAPARSDLRVHLRGVYPFVDDEVRRFSLREQPKGLALCTDQAPGFEGWVRLDLPLSARLGAGRTSALNSPRARLRFGDDGQVCVHELSGGAAGDEFLNGKADKLEGGVPLLVRGHLWRAHQSCRLVP